MKHYMDIERCRTENVEVEGIIFPKNTDGFKEGDIISITEKIDGANTSITFDLDADEVKAFSSKNELGYNNTLRGFFQYMLAIDKTPFLEHKNYIFFGEWLVSHSVPYNEEYLNKWYIFSIYNKDTKRYLPQTEVKDICEKYDLLYVPELYYGPFISWEHCLSFMEKPSFGEYQEGIVVKNQTCLLEGRRLSHALKIVSSKFKEIQLANHIKKVTDPNKLQEKARSENIMSMAVTEARVKKIFLKCVDEGILPNIITPRDMGLVAKTLPRLVFEDIQKEEPQIIKEAGEYAGKYSNVLTMRMVKEIFQIG